VISHDRHFLTVMSLLLARRNCSVTTTANASRVTELVARKSVDVVVIDASQLPAAATVAKLKALALPVGVVVVADEGRSGRSDPPTLLKWGPFEDFIEAIERENPRRGTSGER
jgi:DNA-binding NtrC family response regulator